MTYYAYLHARPDTKDAFGVFYVGKGKGKRAYELDRPNQHHRNIVNKYGKENILVGKLSCSSETIAFDLEIGIIKCLRRMGVALSNKTNGGDGVKGFVRSKEWRERHSNTMMGHPAWNKGMKLSEEHKERISKFRPSFSGKTHTKEARAKMGVNKSLVWVNNGFDRKRVKPEEVETLLGQGYQLGIKFNR